MAMDEGNDAMGSQAEYEKILRLAQQGDAIAQYQLACRTRSSRVNGASSSDAAEWFWKAAVQGHLDAKYALMAMAANMHLDNECEEDVYRWCRELAEQGDAQAQYYWSIFLVYQSEVLTQLPCDVHWLIKSADQGYAPAICMLGMLHECGDGVEKDAGKALELYRKAAELGDAGGQAVMGSLHARGHLVEQSDGEAMKWLERAAEGGVGGAWVELGKLHEKRESLQGYQDAVHCYNKAIGIGNMEGMYYLGRMYERGYGVEQDFASAVKLYWDAIEWKAGGPWDSKMDIMDLQDTMQNTKEINRAACREAAERGEPAAQVIYGLLSYDVHSGWTDANRDASRWFRLSAEQGNKMGQFCWGCMVEFMLGRDNDSETIHWFKKASGQGFSPAQAALGRLCRRNGNCAEAAQWYLLAAGNGCFEAKIALGQMCFKGEGLTQDYAAAAKWFRRANEWNYFDWRARIRGLLRLA